MEILRVIFGIIGGLSAVFSYVMIAYVSATGRTEIKDTIFYSTCVIGAFSAIAIMAINIILSFIESKSK